MKIARCALFILVVALLSSCVGVTRGMYNGSFVSTGQPQLTVSVPSMQLITSGEVIPSVTTTNSLGGVPVRTDLAIYGAKRPDSGMAMAIVALSETPGPWYWDSDTTALFSLTKGFAVIGGLDMQACTYIVRGDNDAFAPLSGAVDPDATLWLARRFAARVEIDRDKLTLEYREPLPRHISPKVTRMGELSFADADAVRAFEKRAEEVFTVSRVRSTDQVPRAYPEGVRVRFINNNFLGTMSSYEPMGK